MGAYLRKMAIDGYVIKLELPELKEMIRLLGIANNNINQIARSLNSTGRIYETDIQRFATESTVCTTVQERFWILLRRFLKRRNGA
mgnify:CR=1 FL=1